MFRPLTYRNRRQPVYLNGGGLAGPDPGGFGDPSGSSGYGGGPDLSPDPAPGTTGGPGGAFGDPDAGAVSMVSRASMAGKAPGHPAVKAAIAGFLGIKTGDLATKFSKTGAPTFSISGFESSPELTAAISRPAGERLGLPSFGLGMGLLGILNDLSLVSEVDDAAKAAKAATNDATTQGMIDSLAKSQNSQLGLVGLLSNMIGGFTTPDTASTAPQGGGPLGGLASLLPSQATVPAFPTASSTDILPITSSFQPTAPITIGNPLIPTTFPLV